MLEVYRKMEKEKDYRTEDLIKSADELIEDSKVEDLQQEIATETQAKIQSEIQKKEIETLGLEVGPVVDGIVEIRVLKDDMEVKADFYPPGEGGIPVEEWDVKGKLEEFGIVHGIDWDTINSKISECNNEQVQINDVIIARGEDPVDEVPEHLVIEEHLQEKPKKTEDEEGSLDYKERTSYILVKKGEILGHLVPKKEGKFGKTVKGELIPYKKTHITQIKPGKNTEYVNGNFVSTCDGRFEYVNYNVWVYEIFEVNGDVDYKTGNISFPGDIIIHGQVSDGFKVDSGGTIICKGTLDASDIICEKDLMVDKGIIGRKKGSVKVGGTIKAKYIENCYVEARDSIYVSTGILHSVVRTLDKLEMGQKSIIVGGKIFAQNGLEANQIGTKMGIKTEIHCGIDHTIQQKLEWIKDKTVALALKLEQIEGRIKSSDSNNERLIEMRDKIKDHIHKLNNAAKSLVIQLDKNEKADVIAQGTVFPGVYIEICHVPYIVPHEAERVRFFLNRERRKIEAENL